tara:strand:- start:1680 stop:1865 length:186 start_codon:yes stop_codon:yes gene_type:complete
MDPESIEAIDYRKTNSVKVLRLKIDLLLKRIESLENENDLLRDEIGDLNNDIQVLERSVYR